MIANARHEFELTVAREILYRFLAWGFTDPRRNKSLGTITAADASHVQQAVDIVRAAQDPAELVLGPGEISLLELDLTPLWEHTAGADGWHADEFTRVFGLVACRDCPPYETEYLENEEPFFRNQHLADLAGFYRAFGLQLSSTRRDRADHIAVQLEFAAALASLEREAIRGAGTDGADQVAICHDAQRAFVRDHLAWWVPSFALAVRYRSATGFYHSLVQLLTAFVTWDRHRWGIAPPLAPMQVRTKEHVEPCEGCLLSTN